MNSSTFQLVDEPTHDDMVGIPECIQHHFSVYLNALEGAQGVAPHDLYAMLLTSCEKPLLELVMDKARGNQSVASEWLGMNRASLRKKLVQYGML